MLFNELDIERQLASDWVESKLYCSADGDDEEETVGEWIAGAWHTAVDAGVGISAALTPDIVLEAIGVKEEVEAIREGVVEATRPEDSTERTGGEDGGRTSEGATADQKRESAARWQDQCFLIEGWSEIRDKFRSCKNIKEESGYQHIIPVVSEAAQIVSTLADRTDVNIFFSLSPAQLSMLIPSIRLFIVNYKQTTKNGHSTVVPTRSQELYLDDYTEESLVQKIMSGGER